MSHSPSGLTHLITEVEDTISWRNARVRPDAGLVVLLVALAVFCGGMTYWLTSAVMPLLGLSLSATLLAIAVLMFLPKSNPFLHMFLRLFGREIIRISDERLRVEYHGPFLSEAIDVGRDQLKTVFYGRTEDSSFVVLRLIYRVSDEPFVSDMASTMAPAGKLALYRLLQGILCRRNWGVDFTATGTQTVSGTVKWI